MGDYIFVRLGIKRKLETLNSKLEANLKPQARKSGRFEPVVAREEGTATDPREASEGRRIPALSASSDQEHQKALQDGALQTFHASGRTVLLVGLVFFVTGCRLAPLAPVNLEEGGWKVREGQAVWKRNKDAPEIAGDVMVATRADGSTFVQFTKTPFPMIIAQTTPNRWQIEIPMENKRYTGPGSPPKRVIWAYLPRLLAGKPPPRGWSWTRLPDSGWRLENSQTGEMLQGYLSPAVR